MIIYKNELPDSDSFFTLYKSTGWDNNEKEQLYESIKNSWYIIIAYYNAEIIGCGRIISDGYLHAFITELIILPKYQNKGVGKEILAQLVNKALNEGISDIQLFCAKDKKQFYLKNGFEVRPDYAPGMQYKIY